MQLRQQVFVVEQNCPYLDADGLDFLSRHVFATDTKTAQLIACARIVPPLTRFAESSIGRVANRIDQRGTGLGIELMQRTLAFCDQVGIDKIRISAQRYLEKFYTSFGFSVDSAPYEEDGIAHIEMLRTTNHGIAQRDESHGVGLTPLRAEHAPALFKLLSADEIYRFTDLQAPASIEALAQRWARLAQGAPQDTNEIWLNWIVHDFVSGQHLGVAQATIYPNATAELAYQVAPQFWGKGIGTRLIQAIAELLNHRFGMVRLCAQTDVRNTASWRALQRAGFSRVEELDSQLEQNGIATATRDYRYERLG